MLSLTSTYSEQNDINEIKVLLNYFMKVIITNYSLLCDVICTTKKHTLKFIISVKKKHYIMRRR